MESPCYHQPRCYSKRSIGQLPVLVFTRSPKRSRSTPINHKKTMPRMAPGLAPEQLYWNWSSARPPASSGSARTESRNSESRNSIRPLMRRTEICGPSQSAEFKQGIRIYACFRVQPGNPWLLSVDQQLSLRAVLPEHMVPVTRAARHRNRAFVAPSLITTHSIASALLTESEPAGINAKISSGTVSTSKPASE